MKNCSYYSSQNNQNLKTAAAKNTNATTRQKKSNNNTMTHPINSQSPGDQLNTFTASAPQEDKMWYQKPIVGQFHVFREVLLRWRGSGGPRWVFLNGGNGGWKGLEGPDEPYLTCGLKLFLCQSPDEYQHNCVKDDIHCYNHLAMQY